MIRELSEAEFHEEAASALAQIFVNENPYDMPFAPTVAGRMIVYKYRYTLDPPLIDALIETARGFGEEGFFASILDRPDPKHRRQPYHWFIPFTDIADYPALIGPVENVIYSRFGRWGLMGSDQWHGLLGGTTAFLETLRHHLPQLDHDVEAFLEEWKGYHEDRAAEIHWIPSLLEHVYGRERSDALLALIGFTLQ